MLGAAAAGLAFCMLIVRLDGSMALGELPDGSIALGELPDGSMTLDELFDGLLVGEVPVEPNISKDCFCVQQEQQNNDKNEQ